jgi:hypothetical protein
VTAGACHQRGPLFMAVQSEHEISGETGSCSPRQSRRCGPAIGEERDARAEYRSGPVVRPIARMTTNDLEQSSTGRGESVAGVDLYWLPLGAGGHSVRLNGRVFEAVVSRLEHRPACDLYHSALEVRVPEGHFVIEQAPVPGGDGARRGVAAGGAVGARWAGRFRTFRYEVRRWRDGVIPDVGEAVDSPRRLTDDAECARRVLDLVPSLPTPVWGRDELAAGEMWNSNSVISWLIARSGLNPQSIQPLDGGRAPGWRAGLVVARRLAAQQHPA